MTVARGRFFPLTDFQLVQMERDLADFVRGKKRLVAVKRWVTTQDAELDRNRVAAHIAEMFREKYLNPEAE
jgi:hypothetical protein